jgi:GLPGLI family protein
MTTVIRVLILVLAAGFSAVNAQDFQGEAIYRTQRKVNIKLDSTKMSGDMQKQMQEMLKKQFQKTFVLNFDKEQSVYKEDISLSPPQPGLGSGMMVQTLGGGAQDILWKNTKEGRFVNQTDLMGKIFLIRDSLPKLDWELKKDTKYIGQYTCYKATLTREIEVVKSGISINGDKDLSEDKTTKETQIITAWYTPEIPVNHGPQKYQGLPGLILEVNDGSQTVICSKIILNPENPIDIRAPKKGKEINQKDFDVIEEKKREELLESFKGRGRDGESIQIRIGG